MFGRKSKIISNREELGNYIEDFDVYNSLLLDKLSDPSLSRVPYIIQTYEYRPDLISQDFYGSPNYVAVIMIAGGLKVEDFRIGTTLYLLPKDVVDGIISSI